MHYALFSPNSAECPGLGIAAGQDYYSPGRETISPDSNAVNPRQPPAPLSPWEPRPKPGSGPGSSRRGKTPAPGDSSGAAASGVSGTSGSGQSAVSVGPSAGRSTDNVSGEYTTSDVMEASQRKVMAKEAFLKCLAAL